MSQFCDVETASHDTSKNNPNHSPLTITTITTQPNPNPDPKPPKFRKLHLATIACWSYLYTWRGRGLPKRSLVVPTAMERYEFKELYCQIKYCILTLKFSDNAAE